jgi:uncharacterized protein YbjT (DUF2867 family)
VRVTVAGGTGVVGRHVVAALRRRGDDAVVLARSAGVDVVSGAGLDAALDGCDAVVDVVSVTTTRAAVAVEFFETATGNLVAAAARAGAGHVVALSIVGIDDVDLGYYRGKRVQEQVVRSGPVPWTVLRATQFHEFPGQLLGRQRGPVAFVPTMLSAPVAAAEAGAHVADLVHAGPQGMAAPLRGPETGRMVDLARRLVAATGRRRLVVPLPVPGASGRALRAGALVPGEPCVRGTLTFEEYLAGLPTVRS